MLHEIKLVVWLLRFLSITSLAFRKIQTCASTHLLAVYVRKSLLSRGKTSSSYWLKSLPAKAFRTNSFAPKQTCHHLTFQSPLLKARDYRWFSNLVPGVSEPQSGAELWPPEAARCHWPMVQADWTYGRFVVKWFLQRMAGLRPGEAPDVPTPDLFPLTLYYRWGGVETVWLYTRRVSIRLNFSVHTFEQVLNLPQW